MGEALKVPHDQPYTGSEAHWTHGPFAVIAPRSRSMFRDQPHCISKLENIRLRD